MTSTQATATRPRASPTSGAPTTDPARLLASRWPKRLRRGRGGDDDEGDAGAITVTSTSTQTETAAQTSPEPASKPKPLTPAERAEKTVAAYYAAVDARRFGAAWDLLAPTLQAELGGYATWKAGYQTTVATKAKSIDATSVTSLAATVALELKATDSDACGDLVGQTFAGTWSLIRARKAFLGSAFSVEKTGGGTPVTDASGCSDGGGGGVVAPAAGCDPNYTGCVPPYPPDVDCWQVRQEVDVIGDDVHQLDLGFDGEACEMFFR